MPNYDALIIGAGPAGLSAARVIAEGGVTCAVVDKMGPGGQLMNMGEIHDWAEAGTSGPDLIETLVDPVLAAGADLLIDEVVSAERAASWTVAMLDQTVTAKALVVATGLSHGTTGLPNEADFEGRGISHCAMCDGPLYAGKRVVVAGDDRWTVQEAIELTAVADHVALVTAGGDLMEASPVQAQRLAAATNFTSYTGRISGLIGSNGLEQVTVDGADSQHRIEASGLFLFTNRRGATAFLAAPDVTGANGLVLANAEGATSNKSLFVCGDTRKGAMQSVASAIADGRRTGQTVLRWLRDHASE